ncbi:MAG: hypothetical protein GY722_07225 [bacterium]|nr:hypothetical protein [bacterium]
MRTLKTLKPGQDGTKELLTRFGPTLLYVRYRSDEDRRERLKTVELVVERRPRGGEAEGPGSRPSGVRAVAVASRRVALRIGRQERRLQRRVKSAAAGGTRIGECGCCGRMPPSGWT